MAFPASSPAALDLVPPEHLEPPPGDELRYLVRDECALLLDGYLRRLARQEALARDVLGSLARAFLGQRGQHALGFARVRDYARERLGLAAAWIARAQAVTVRRLVDEVEWVVERRAAGVSAAASEPPPPGTRLVLPERQMRAQEECPPVDAEIIFFAPASLAVLLREVIAAFAKPLEPPWRGFERLLGHAEAEWQGQPRSRDPVFARDGWRCTVPACTSRRNLHDHHLLFRSRGGGNARANRITVCAWHHLRGIHQGRVRAWGTAPDDVTWELGVRPGCTPLLRLHGDEYVVERA